MDFHLLSRRQLQALCKKNKIPANLTNISMADALAALSTIEGIEEVLLTPSESSIESPPKSLRLPRTASTTTTTRRMRAVTDESDVTSQSSTVRTTRRSARRDDRNDYLAQTPAKMESLHFEEIEDEKEDGKICNEKGNLPDDTPALVPASRRRGLTLKGGGETTLTKVQGTRRSSRLAIKTTKGRNNKTSETVSKMEFLSNDFGESLEINVKVHSSADDVDSVAQSSGVISGIKSAVKNHKKFEIGFDEDSGRDSEIVVDSNVDGDETQADRGDKVLSDGHANRTENALENSNEDIVNNNNVAAEEGVEEILIDHHHSVDNSADFNMSKEEAESKKDLGSSHDTNIPETKIKNVLEDGIALNDENEVVSTDCAAEIIVGDLNPWRIDDDVMVESDGEIDLLVPKNEEQEVGVIIKPSLEPMFEISNPCAEEAFANNLAEKSTGMMELNTSGLNSEVSWAEDADFGVEPSVVGGAAHRGVVTLKQLGSDGVIECCDEPKSSKEELNNACIVVVNFEECSSEPKGVNVVTGSNEENSCNFGGVTVKESPTPRKIALKKVGVSKTPSGASKRMIQVSDDKENMNTNTNNSGTKQQLLLLINRKEGKEAQQPLRDCVENEKICVENEKICVENEKSSQQQQQPLRDEKSLRKLKKELKAKLEMAANNNVKATTTTTTTTTTRPALQALTENRF